MIDVHAHLVDEQFEKDLPKVVARAVEDGVAIISAGCCFSTSKTCVELSEKFESVFATVGIHPQDVDKFEEGDLAKIEKLAKGKKVVAIGEIGLDYHYFDGLTKEEVSSNKQRQKELFVSQIEIANRLDLPVVVHCRDAMGDTIEILKNNPLKKESLLHCYGGSVESARILMRLGFSFSFGGVSTFKNARNVQAVIKELPIEKIMLETDCPYLSPEPFRGRRNEPRNVVYVADLIAKIKGLSIEEVASKTTENAKRMFGI